MKTITLLTALSLAAASLGAQAPDTKITWGAYVDAYFAYDFGRPPTFDRSFAGGAPFTTQPARHNEFNVNLAFIEAKLESPRTRGRLALQTGTSVQSNYSAEPVLARPIQEAVAGMRLSDRVWVDGGVFFSHIGMESWLSRDNPTYTRSLAAEYSPYYQSGVKITYGGARLTAAINVVNGWQNISENNSDKGVGARLDYAANASVTLSYYNFFSGEGAAHQLRTLNGAGVRVVRARTTLLGQADYGTQDGASGAAGTSWYGATVIARVRTGDRSAIAVRAERFDDPDQTIVVTGSSDPFRGNGASLGFDFAPARGVLWRSELRGWTTGSDLFPNGIGAPKGSNAFVVTSLSLTF